MTTIHMICYLCFRMFRIWFLLVVHSTTEISMIAQLRLCNRSSKRRIHPAHQYWLITKSLCNPFAYRRFRLMESIPYPQAVRKRRTIIATTKYCSIRWTVECCLYFLLSGSKVFVALIVGIFYRLQTCIQSVAFRHFACRRTSKER